MRWLLPRYVRRVLTEPISSVVLSIALVLACERTPPASGRKDTVVPVAPPPETTAVTPPEVSTWDSTAGPALFIVGPTAREAFVIAPRFTDTSAIDSARFESAVLRALQLELFAGGSRVGYARITTIVGSTRTDSCRVWPIARLEQLAADTASSRDWAIGFSSNHAAELPVDSITGLTSADSARLAADIARIASALPGDTSATFRGLPFVVTKAWRSRAVTGPQILAAIVVRNVNQEANPQQERILLIAERDTTTATPRYSPRYSERVNGPEEAIETTDLVAIVLLGADRRPTLIITREAGSGSSYALIERIAGVWQRRWASAYAGC